MPFEEFIDWKDVCLWVEQSELHYIIEKILDFHHSMTKDQFIDRQLYCRELWLKYFSKEGFYFYFNNYLQKNYKNNNEVML